MFKKVLTNIGAMLQTEIPLPFRSYKTEPENSAKKGNPLLHLNVKRVLEDHENWITRIKGTVDGTNPEELDLEFISAPDQCELGIWIYHKDTKSLWENPEYPELRRAHKEFHKLAGRVYQEFLQGDKISAMNVLRGDLRKISSQIQLSLIRLHAQK